MIEWIRDDHEDARIVFDERNLRDIKVFIDGPKDSAYEGGTFELDVHFPKRYPREPPKIEFKTKIFHLNITDQGRIFLDTLTSKWDGKRKFGDVIDSIIEMLEDGEENKDHPLNATAALFYKDSVDKYRTQAIEQTKLHAILKTKEDDDVKEKDIQIRSRSILVDDSKQMEEDNIKLNVFLFCVNDFLIVISFCCCVLLL